jgi:hypothetical protein
MTFGERSGAALLRRFALDVLRQDESKGSLTGKMQRARRG